MKNVLCFAVDAQTSEGSKLVSQFNVSGLPALIFLDPDGQTRDRISGYLAPAPFLKEVRRIEKGDGTLHALRQKLAGNSKDVITRFDLALKLLQVKDNIGYQRELALAKAQVARDEGFDPKSIDERWRLSQVLRNLGDAEGSNRQVEAIRALDPEAKSAVMRGIKLSEITQRINARYVDTKVVDTGELKAFLAEEQYPAVRFEGWSSVQNAELFVAGEAQKVGLADEVKSRRAAARVAGQEAWRNCPVDKVAVFGRSFASTFLTDVEALTQNEKDLAVEVALSASLAAPESADHLDVLAQCLFAAGKKDEAIDSLKRALEIAPAHTAVQERLAQYKGM